jgi:uncharacterized protein YkwD
MMKPKTFAATIAAITWALVTTLASALDLNSFRAQHGRPALAMSPTLAALAYEQANSMANRKSHDHKNYRARTDLGFTRDQHY